MKFLLIEDDAGCRLAIEAFIQSKVNETAEFEFAQTLEKGLVAAKNADVIILDLTLPDSQVPAETIAIFTPIFTEVPTIIVSGSQHLPNVMDAIDRGACAYICKPKLEGMAESLQQIIKKLKAKQGT